MLFWGNGLMGNSSTSFMGTFLTGSLGSPPSHPSHPSGPPASPSSPSFHGGPHSSASQIWFPHSHEAPGYPRFSGSLAHTFLPMSHLDHHGNSSVLYGQHPFYDAQKENFYLRGLPSQEPLLPANHGLPPVSRTASSQPLRSCSRERDMGGDSVHKSLKEGGAHRPLAPGTKEKERSTGKQEAKDRQQHKQQAHPNPHSHQHPHPQPPSSLEEENSRALARHKATLVAEYKDDSVARDKHLSACLLHTKAQNGSLAAVAKGSLLSCGGGGSNQGRNPGAGGNLRCAKDGLSPEMRISEKPSDCLERAPTLHHSMPYRVPTSLGSAVNAGGFHCLPLHPSHHHHPPHHPHHPHHPYHTDFYSPPPPPPLANPAGQEKGLSIGGQDPKTTGPTFVPSVSHQGDKTNEPFQLRNPDCRRVGGGRGNGAAGTKDKSMEKSGSESGVGSNTWPRKQQQQPPPHHHAYAKAEKAPDWLQSQQQHNQHAIPPTHLGPRPRSGDCINNSDLDFRPSLPQAGLSTPSFRNCSHLGLSTNGQVPEGKVPQGGGIPGGCVLQRDGQKVARIRHQQHHRAVSDDSGPKLGLGCSGAEGKRKTDMPTLGYVCGSGQQQPVPPWAVRASQLQVDEEQRKGYLESLTGGTVGRPQGQQQPLPGMGPPSGPQDSKGPQGEGGAMRNLLKYSSQQQPLLLSQRNPFGGLGCLKSGAGGDSCPVQGDKHALPSRKTPSADGDRPDCGRKSRESGDMPHSEGEVRQPPVGIAVAVARQREPTCHPMDGSTSHTRQDRMMPTLKGAVKPVFPLDLETEEERKRMCEEQLGRPCLERDRELLVRDNKKRVEFARIHPSSSCHGDITPHLMVPGGTSLQSSQLGADPTPHVHPAHHHWMSQTGSPSLWVTGHSYGIGHAALHQNLPPAFSAPMPGPLQPVLPLSQDSSTPLVVLSSEPTARPATHHLDVIEQPGLWPPVYGARGPPSHMQHATVFSQSQFLRQQEFYALQQQQQQQQQQQHRVAQSMELQHRSSHPQTQKKTEEPPMDLEELISEPGTLRPAKPFSFVTSHKKTASSVSCPTRLSPCCRSPSLRPHPKSTPCTPCPTPSPAAAAPHSPALSPAPPRKTKGAEAQDMRAEGQPPQDYPQTLEPDLPPGYTYPAIVMGYRSGPSPQDVQLAEPADLEAAQAEPSQRAPSLLPALGKKHECSPAGRTFPEQQQNAEEEVGTTMEDGVLDNHVAPEQEQEEVYRSCCLEERLAHEATSTSEDAQRDGIPVSNPKEVEEEDNEEIPMVNEEVQEEGMAKWKEEVTHADQSLEQPTCSQSEEAIPCEAAGPKKSCDEDLSSPVPTAAISAVPCPASTSPQAPILSCWSLELLIAATLCASGNMPPPNRSSQVLPCHSNHGMELLSELAELELRQRQWDSGGSSSCQEEELLTFDLHNLATLATARALELGPEGSLQASTEQPGLIRRTVNLRRKCSWTPRHEPVCPVKGAMETMGAQELAMRVQLAELQQRYKEKQRELAKLQRKHDHQREETPRSPARRGPGRPRKRKSTHSTGTATPADGPRKIKSLGVGVGLQSEDTAGGKEVQKKKKKKPSNQSFDWLSSAQMKAQCYKSSSRPAVLSSKLACKVSRLKQKVKTTRASSAGLLFGRRHGLVSTQGQGPARRSNDSDDHSDTEEDEEEGSCDSEGQDDIRVSSSRDSSSSSVVPGPSPSSVVKLEANQKARNKKERQGLYGSPSLFSTEGQVKVKKKAPCRSTAVTAIKKRLEDREQEGAKITRTSKPCAERSLLEKPQGGAASVSIAERLKRASCKNSARHGAVGKPKGHAVSRLLESFATNEGFQIDEDSSFSEGDEDSGPSGCSSQTHRSPPATPSCILTRKVLTNGLKVLVSKEDELMYAARVYTLELPDIYKIVIDGERGNRQRIYTLDQLVDEAVLDVCPETEELLTAGTRVCAYWSERSRCLYPGYVRRGSPGEEGKAGSVMVEFDDGDRGWISLAHIRLLPPDYQIRSPSSFEPSATAGSSAQRGIKTSNLEKTMQTEVSSKRPSKTEISKDTKTITVVKAKPGRPKGSGIKTRLASSMSRNTSSFLSWPNVAVPKKKAPHNPFQVNGIPRKPLKRKKAETFPLSTDPATAATKGIFKSSFAVDSFSSIANGYSSFGSQSAVIPINPRSSLYSRNKKLGEGTGLQGRKAEFLVKLDHEGVTSPKTKSSKALLLHGSPGQGSQLDKGFGTKGLGCLTHPTGYSHPVLLVKDNKKGNGDRAELLLKGASSLKKPTPPMALAEYADFGMNCHSDCPSSYSDMDEEDEDERESALVTASGGLRTAGSFLSRLSVSSSSSGSSSSSSSGSLSSSSLCSSDNDSSYSSEDEESSTLLLQSCLSSQHSLLQTTESASGPLQGSFVAKAMAVAGTKSGSHSSTNSKPLKRKEYPNSVPKDSKDVAKRPKLQVINNQPKISSFLSAQQLWKWSGNPTQRRGMKGKARKLFYKAIVRGKDMVRVGDCAVFLSAGRPHLPYVGRIESFWESWAGSMVVKVKWFYHPEETKLGKRHGDGKHALYQSSHEDENDVQTISHKCQVVSREEYERLIRGRKPAGANHDLYYLAGTYDPTSGQLVTAEGLPILC
ncbi:BAH and coiled-coil domain-containing protein 1 isoform X2 [Scleropages formosus]|uniref:BAH and coiled-coil domain-containing protein 1 isoform X2 n=1 Tax=Scleropages formosus TaxID=113540 RepID=UPI000878A0A7|nr:BAH and coiled-coil domain-containing protein 1-like isoform X2 [Scleropages formosus]